MKCTHKITALRQIETIGMISVEMRDQCRAQWRALDRHLVGIAVDHVKDMRANCPPQIWDEQFWIDMIKSYRESHSISIKCEQLRIRAQ